MDLNALAALWWARRQRRRGPAQARSRTLATRAILGLLAAYLGGAALWAGLAAGAALPGLDPVRAGALLWRIPLLLGLAGALWDGGCVLDPAPCRPLFIQGGTLVAAEAMLGLTTPIKAVLGALGLLASLGLGWGRPALLPAGLLGTALVVVWTACLERLIHVLLPAGILRQRRFLVVFLGLGAGLAAMAWLAGRPPRMPFLPVLERVYALPGVDLVRFAQGAGARCLRPLAATLALLAFTGMGVRLELASPRRPGSALAGGRPIAFSRPWLGVARLQFHQLLGSRSGQSRLLMLLLSVAIAKEPELITVGTLATPRAWTAISAALTLGAVLVVPLCNLLGYDRGGVRSWWRAPLLDRHLLLGKVLGCAAYAALAAPVLLLLASLTMAWRLRQLPRPGGITLELVRAARPGGAGELLATALLLAALFLWLAGSGLGRSLAAPRPMALGSYGMSAELDDAKIARIGVLLAPLVVLGPVYAAALRLGWQAAAAAMAAALLVAAVRFRRCLGQACRNLAEQRETITCSLASGP